MHSRPMRSGPPPRLPVVCRGLRIGLFGGSFNPPHEGHLLVAETALRRLRLHQIWWLVTPGNPLKKNSGLPPLAERIAACKALARGPRMIVSGMEAGIGTVFTQQTVAYLARRLAGVRLVWIMGADSMIGFHRWQRWRSIAGAVPLVVVDRPGATLGAAVSRSAQTLARARVAEVEARDLALRRAPAWTFLHGPRSRLSSTDLRMGKTVVKRSGIRG